MSRTRKEIEESLRTGFNATLELDIAIRTRVTVELLLDIRDLLSPKEEKEDTCGYTASFDSYSGMKFTCTSKKPCRYHEPQVVTVHNHKEGEYSGAGGGGGVDTNRIYNTHK